MQAVADTRALVADGIITPAQAAEIERRARAAMLRLAINLVLTGGILAATAGLIAVLAEPAAVAAAGGLALAGGIAILRRGGSLYAMFGNAASLIGAGMLLGGLAVELLDKVPDFAGLALAILGAAVAALSGRALLAGADALRFVLAAVLLMGLAMHLGGLAAEVARHEIAGVPKALLTLYAAAAIAAAGWLVDVRAVTALAILPFAQTLDTGTAYFHAAYVFYSPEPALSILQMALLIVACLWVVARRPERTGRHAAILALLAFVVANLCALVGSLWGDVVGDSMSGLHRYDSVRFPDYADYEAAREAFLAAAPTVSEHVFAIGWAVALAALIFWTARSGRRGLFNAGVTFAAIHAYTQAFESFGDEPLAYVIGGLAAIPLAWGMWRLNAWLLRRAERRTHP